MSNDIIDVSPIMSEVLSAAKFIRLVKENPDWRLSVQAHKGVGVR